MCRGCGEASEGLRLKRCTGCRKALFCSKQCSKRAWGVHKKECKKEQKKRLKAADG